MTAQIARERTRHGTPVRSLLVRGARGGGSLNDQHDLPRPDRDHKDPH